MHVMVDLEIMSTAHNSAIAQIGACVFSMDGVGSTFSCLVSLKSCQLHGLDIDGATVAWWLRQEHDAIKSIAAGEEEGLTSALTSFARWLELEKVSSKSAGGNVHIWGNGATFDNVILRNAYKAASIIAPWSCKHDRCYRTMRNVLRRDGDDVPFEGIRHSAIDDAKHQARQLVTCMKNAGMALE